MSRSLAAYLRPAEEVATGLLRSSGFVGDGAARAASLLPRARVVPAFPASASGGPRFLSSARSSDDAHQAKGVIYPQALKDQLEKEGKLPEHMRIRLGMTDKEQSLQQALQMERSLSSQQRDFFNMLTSQQNGFDDKMATMRKEFENKLASQRKEYEDKLASQRKEYEDKLASQRKEYEDKLSSERRDSDLKYNSLLDKMTKMESTCKVLQQKQTDFQENSDMRIEGVKFSFYKGLGTMVSVFGAALAIYNRLELEVPLSRLSAIKGNPHLPQIWKDWFD